jgi:hypothetical protein
MYNPDYINWGQQGWVCSKCGKSFAPHVSECPYCNAERRTFATTSTDKTTVIPFDDRGWWEDYNKRSTGDVESIVNSWKTFSTCGLTEENLEKLCGTKRDTVDFILNNY